MWRVGDVVDRRYKVLRVYESGGMGVVYRVRHLEWDTDLAVKCPRTELFRSASQRNRFVAEAEIWVSLGLHPNVCACHYVRVLGGIPRVFAEHVSGGSLRDWIVDRRLYDGGRRDVLARVLDIAVQFAWGLAHAHDHGIVHQDVKPANVLLDVTAGGVVAKVTDFGLAKAARAVVTAPPAAPAVTSLVASNSGGLTPAYASPEQSEGRPMGRRTDVYSFAVSVLEMFTGDVGWRSGPAAGAALAARRAKPGTPELRPELADLLARCLSLDPAARPASMTEVAGELIEIYRREIGTPYPRSAPAAADLWADELNNRGVSLLDLGRPAEATEAFAAALAADPQHLNATYNAGLLRWRRGECTDEDLLAALDALPGGAGSGEARRLLAHVHRERGDHDQAAALLGRAATPSGGTRRVPWYVHRERVEKFFDMEIPWAAPTMGVRFTRDGRRAVTACDGVLRVWDVDGGRRLREVAAPTVEFKFDIDDDGRYAITSAPDAVHFWDLTKERRLRVIGAPSTWRRALWSSSVRLSGNGRVAVSANYDGNVLVWDFPSGRLLLTLDGHTNAAAAVDDDGRFVFTAGREDGTARLWEVATGRCVQVLDGRVLDGHKGVDTVFLGADHAALAAGGRIRVWDLRRNRTRTLNGHTRLVTSVSVSGGLVVSTSADDTVRLWALDDERCLRTFRGDGGPLRAAHLDADADMGVLRSAWQAGLVRWWALPSRNTAPPRLSRPREHAELSGLDATVTDLMNRARQAADPQTALDLLAEARAVPGCEREPRLLTAWRELGRSAVRVGLREAWAAGIFEGDPAPYALELNADGRIAVSGGSDGTVRVWDVDGGTCVRVLAKQPSLVKAVGTSADGSRAMAASRDGTITVWSAETGERIGGLGRPLALGVNAAAFDRAGHLAVAAGADAVIRVWNLDTGECERELPGHAGEVTALWLGPALTVSVSASADGAVRLWDLKTGQCVRTLHGHTDRVMSVCLSPDGRYALSAGAYTDWTIRLWDTATGECLSVFDDEPDDPVPGVGSQQVRFCPDGRFAISGGTDAAVRIWEPAAGRCLRVLDGHQGAVNSVVISTDALFALSASTDGTIRRWELDWDLRIRW